MRSLVAIAVLAVGLAGTARAQDEPAALVVNGQGVSTAAPDMATLRTGVLGEGESAGDAIDALSAGLDPVMAALAEAGIAPVDIQTGSLQLSPVYDDSEVEPRGPGTPPRIVGYRAESLLSVRVRDLDALSGVIDRVVTEGANRLDGIGFGLADPVAAEDAALAAAVEDAMRRAAVMAAAAGRRLGPILEVTETGGGGQPTMMRAAMESDAVAIAPGELEIQQQVRLRIALAED